ncbi:MAG: sigma-70 family RNA polymerase sigma factor [Planctomycetes bacterium]|nr:sigma-70 family RNA polymerase sigma factor [Planctomycetota bacterium]
MSTVLSAPHARFHPARDSQVERAELHVPRLLRVARSILGSEDLAWDAVQDALMCLWHEREEPRDLRGWLVRTTVHRSLHHARSLARRRRHEDLAARDAASSEGAGAFEESEQRELARELALAIRGLPAAFRATFRLREIEGLEYDEIARRLRVPVGTVRSRLNRAKRMLRSVLAERLHDEELCAICAREGHSEQRANRRQVVGRASAANTAAG